MKPAPFDYYAPKTTQQALAYVGEFGYEAKALAGGQSLIPTMNFRLAEPAILVDLNPIEELAYIHPTPEGGLLLGAMTRVSDIERHSIARERAPLVQETIPYIAHEQIRNRSTIGGTMAHADPAAELPAIARALKARFKIANQHGERWVEADDFFLGMFFTDLAPEDLLVEVELPPMPPRSGWAFSEVSRRHGDYALVGVAASVTLDQDNRCQEARLVYLSVDDRPLLAEQAGLLLQGQPVSPDLIQAAADAASREDIDPGSDIHASAAYRRHLARILGGQVLTQAFERAMAKGE
jgi:carbon-monoxide dehydrogenase medium subunit